MSSKPEPLVLYSELGEFLRLQQRPLQAMYGLPEVASLFGVSTRTIQSWVADGSLTARKIPGGTKCFPSDLEQFLVASKQGGRK